MLDLSFSVIQGASLLQILFSFIGIIISIVMRRTSLKKENLSSQVFRLCKQDQSMPEKTLLSAILLLSLVSLVRKILMLSDLFYFIIGRTLMVKWSDRPKEGSFSG